MPATPDLDALRRAADALETFASIDEGENVDADELRSDASYLRDLAERAADEQPTA